MGMLTVESMLHCLACMLCLSKGCLLDGIYISCSYAFAQHCAVGRPGQMDGEGIVFIICV